jgi:8-oxo-dGTP pyrophosphatase MutT (NUDIX family)
VAVVRGDGDDARVLLIRRSKGAFAGGWTVVMGGVEPGEHGVAAAHRELHEETGLRAALYTAGVLDAFYDPIRDRIVHVPFFVARIAATTVEITLEDDEHDAFQWVTFAEAETLLMFSAQRRALIEVHDEFIRREPEPWRLLH